MNKSLAKPFLIILIIGVLIGCFLVFRPFLIEIIIAAVLVTILYKPYSKLVKFFKGHRHWSALVMCLLVLFLVILPLTEISIVAARKSITLYGDTVQFLNRSDNLLQNSFLGKLNFLGLDTSSLKNLILDVSARSSNFMVNGVGVIIRGTANFIFSLLLIILTMFFFFVDGERMMKKLMYWSPLPDKYDQRLFKKFQEVSYSTIVSTLIVVTAQGLVGAIGYAIVGLPYFFAGILITIFSLLPVIGSTVIWLPTAIYLLAIGQIWQGVFLILWGSLAVGTIDNILRTYIIKGKASINPIFIFLAILGGVPLFGFWGVVLGPLVISLAVTVFHIYELEFKKDLEPAD